MKTASRLHTMLLHLNQPLRLPRGACRRAEPGPRRPPAYSGWALALVWCAATCGPPRCIGRPAASPAVADTPTYLSDVCALLQKRWPANRTINIVCHGHSVPAGYARTPLVNTLDAYPFLLLKGLKARFPYAVINVVVTAIGGENSEQGARRFARDVLCLRPEVVTIDYGLNDRAIGLARAERAWRSMITQALSRRIKVILLTPTGDLSAHLDDPRDPLNQQARQIRRLAAEYHVGLVDSLALFKAYVRRGGRLADLMAQVNHPNRRGHDIVAAALLKFFP